MDMIRKAVLSVVALHCGFAASSSLAQNGFQGTWINDPTRAHVTIERLQPSDDPDVIIPSADHTFIANEIVIVEAPNLTITSLGQNPSDETTTVNLFTDGRERETPLRKTATHYKGKANLSGSRLEIVWSVYTDQVLIAEGAETRTLDKQGNAFEVVRVVTDHKAQIKITCHLVMIRKI